MAKDKSADLEIRWREWSNDAFDEASRTDKLVLLDLFAPWCHWCHVMDDTTYSDPAVIRIVNEEFIPVRVDIDQRPDISERYNRGGFPTTAFLSDRGESIWGATYVPPEDMRRIIGSVLAAKKSGEVGQALDRERMQFLDVSKALEKRESVDSAFIDAVFEDIFSTYDVEWGGFGGNQKFPHPDVVDLLLFNYLETKDRELSDAASSTLDHMTEGLYDEVEGGVFRYSVTRNWREPHFEKMLETNLGFLRNLVHAHMILGEGRFAQTARGVAKYLLRTLRDESGGFFSSQDADEKYYRMLAGERAKSTPPKVVQDIYSGWNCEATSTFIEAGVMLDERSMVEAGRAAWKYSLDHHWNPKLMMVRHRKGEELYLLEDQVSFLGALLSVAELEPGDDIPRILEVGESLSGAVTKAFGHQEGGLGDIMANKDAIGELIEPRRSIVSNSKWARLSALLGVMTFRPERTAEARAILSSFHPKEVRANGLFAAPYVLAWRTLDKGPQLVEIHEPSGKDIASMPLWREGKRALNPSTVVMSARKVGPDLQLPSRTFAVICRSSGCSKEIEDPGELFAKLRESRAGQV